jgi:hypothetical protein
VLQALRDLGEVIGMAGVVVLSAVVAILLLGLAFWLIVYVITDVPEDFQ